MNFQPFNTKLLPYSKKGAKLKEITGNVHEPINSPEKSDVFSRQIDSLQDNKHGDQACRWDCSCTDSSRH